jgi:hypothetical protein
LEYGLAIPRDTSMLAGSWARNITMGKGERVAHHENSYAQTDSNLSR